MRCLSLLNPGRLPVARLAFRPLFLLAALFSVVSMGIWLAFWHGDILLNPYGGLMFWHQHEMLFGFSTAVVSGFLLTAVQNWTGLPSLKGLPLLALVALWLFARVLLAFPMDLPPWLIAALDLIFLPLVALVVTRLVIAVRRWRNLIFLPVLGLLMLANLAMHVGAIRGDALLVQDGAYLTVLLISLLMVVLGGRVIPMFTTNRLGLRPRATLRWLELLSLGSVMAVVLVQLLNLLGGELPKALQASVMGLAAICNMARLLRWDGYHCWREPLLWGLHISYAFIPLGLAMWGLALSGVLRTELAVHALTVGGMSTMMLAMMARVSLGHTGRCIRTLPGIGVALALMVAAALLRAPILALVPEITHWIYTISILFWCLAYLIFLAHYTRPLMVARVDGRDG
ncbi:NnrS family protein [Halomonas cupida]|uniref:NnrS family protein n=1 Tax=Halomonas cupida TaxID=44933 RepID=UPI003A8DC4F4